MPRHDPAKRRRAVRKGRERGVWVFVPFEDLERTGIVDAADGGAPFYRTWSRKRAAFVQFYAEG